MKLVQGMSLATAVAGACLLAGGASRAYAAPAPMAYVQEHGWDVAPAELDEVRRRGFHDGVEGARKDWGNHRSPNVERRDEYRHPPVAHRDRDAYRDGFRRGYQAGVEHLDHWR